MPPLASNAQAMRVKALCPIIATPGEDLDIIIGNVELHAVAVEFDLMQPSLARGYFLDRGRQLRFDESGFRAVPGAIGSVTHKQGLVMNSQKIAGTLAGIIGLIVLAVAFIYGPIGERNKPAKQVEKNDLAKAPVRGPVVREIPQ